MRVGPLTRIVAAVIAATALVGLLVQFADLRRAHSVAAALWIMAAYFTITTNLLVAVVFTSIAVARGPLRSSRIVAGTMLSILLVGVVNALLLWGALELSGGSVLVDRLLHVATPVLALLFWAVLWPKGALRARDPLLWAIYPLLYLGYAIVRGTVTGTYAYPFLNVLTLGWPRTALNATVIAAGFLAAGYVVVWLDRRLGSRVTVQT